VAGSKKLKAIVVVGKQDRMPQPKDPELWREADRLASAAINDPKNVTAPKKGGLSLYGTNVLMNITNVMGALPTFNAQHTCIEGAEKISGEYIREHRPHQGQHLPRLPRGLQEDGGGPRGRQDHPL
jgi:aldehyde:ferredoxin oxidoreductase